MSETTNQPGAENPPVRFWPYALAGLILLVVFVAGILAPDYFSYRIRLAQIGAASKILAANGTTIPSANAGAAGATNPTSPEIKTSEIFETYGRLVTMLLGFVSVLGVFFGYFVRKSLREVEEDLRDHVTQNMKIWEKEKDRLTKEVDKKLAEITKEQSQFRKTNERSEKMLRALEIAAEEPKPAPVAGPTAAAVAAIDADDTIPKPEGT